MTSRHFRGRRHATLVTATALLVSGLSAVGPDAEAASPTPTAPQLEQGFTATSRWVENPDGTVTRTFFPDVTFRQDAHDAWQLVDPTVIADKDARAWSLASVPGAVRPVRFGRAAGRLVEVDLADGTVTLSLQGTKLATPRVFETGVSYPTEQGDTLAFTSLSAGVKEAITIPHPGAASVYRFHLADPKGALGRPEPTSDGGVVFDRPVAAGLRLALTAPFAYELNDPSRVVRDPHGQPLPSAHLAIRPGGDGFDIVETLDPSWLTHVHGTVVLDPSLTYKGAAQVTDCAVTSVPTGIGAADCSSTSAQVGASLTGAGRMLLRYDLSGFPSPAQVTAASLGLTSAGSGSNVGVELHEAGAAWTTGATWLTTNGTTAWPAGTSGGDPLPTVLGSGDLAPGGAAVTFASAALTSLVSSWISGSAPNRGLVVKTPSETAPGPGFVGVASTESGAATRPALTITYNAPPDAPIAPTATAGDTSLSLSWTAPPANGAPITGYTIRTYSGSTVVATTSAAASASSAVVTGLTNGTTYVAKVTATNSVGTSPEAPSNSVVPAGLPFIPTGVTAARGDESATVSWTAPDANGAAITSYTIKAYAGSTLAATTAVGATTTGTVTGLVNGTAYTFTVAATNSVGTGAASGASAAITPAGVPTGPSAVVGTPGRGSATLVWTAAAGNGAALTGNTIRAYTGGALASTTSVGTVSSATVTGLTDGTAYTFTVTATNTVGDGAASDPSGLVTVGVPLTPTDVTAAAGDRHLQVGWTAPADNGVTISSYLLQAYRDGTLAASSTVAAPATSGNVSGLLNGTSYTVTVTARSDAGSGPASSPSNATGPYGPPLAPPTATATAADQQATISWTAADGNGSPVTGYTVTTYVGSLPISSQSAGMDLSTTITGLTNGDGYWFAVTASNAAGTGLPAVTGTVTPAGVPAAPTYLTGTAGDHQVSLAWTAANANGAPVSGYVIKTWQGATLVSSTSVGADSTATLTGLTNGTSYTFTVAATNRIGTGASSTSEALTPAGLPFAPTDVTATRGDQTVAVSWTAPGDNGAPITGYTLRAYHAGTLTSTTTVGAVSTATLTGLVNGVSYTVTVTAANTVGAGPASAQTAPVTPAGVPAAPATAAATRGDTQATLTWADADGNGDDVTAYVITTRSGTATVSTMTVGSVTSATVTGLANGTAYTFTVAARNSVGDGPGTATDSVTPAGLPTAPSQVRAHAGDQQATLTWTAADGNGDAVTGYQITALDASGPVGSITVAAGTTAAYDGLTNGVAYTFRVAATNGIGTGAASDQTSSVTPAGVPFAATGLSATRGDTQATLAWTAAADNGSALAGNTLRVYTNGSLVRAVEVGAVTSAAITGLDNGTAYTVTVTAHNAAGTGPESTASAPVTPAGTPAAPSNVTAARGDRQAVVTWQPPSGNGDVITGYTLVARTGGTIAATVTVDPATSATVTGLTNGTAYTFTVTASNGVGTGPESEASLDVTPAGLPVPPTTLSVTPGDQQASLSWSGADGNGDPISSYVITTYRGATVIGTSAATSTSATITGLTNGTAYAFTVAPVNGVGTGAESAMSDPVTPAGAPLAPAAPSATRGDQQATVSWTAPDGNGRPISGFTVRAYSGGTVAATVYTSPDTLSTTVMGLTNGVSYTFTVAASNSVGYGPESAPSAGAVPAGAPLAPSGIQPRPADARVTVSWTAADGNGAPVGSYTVQVYTAPGHAPVGSPVTLAGTQTAITGLTNGQAYTAEITATNVVGTGPAGVSASFAPIYQNDLNTVISTGAVSTLAGSGTNSTAAGTGTSASFNTPRGVVVVSGFAYVAGSDAISKVNLANGQVTILAGAPGSTGCTDALSGSGAQFSAARDMATDGSYGYVVDSCGLRRVSLSTGAVNTIVTGAGYQGVTVGPDGMLYVTQTVACSGSTQGTLFRVNPSTNEVTALDAGACGSANYGVAADATSVYFVRYPTQIAKYDISTGTVSTLVSDSTLDYDSSLESGGTYLYTGTLSGTGTRNVLRRYAKSDGSARNVAGAGSGHADGIGSDAWFDGINDLAADGTNLWVADGGNYLRKVSPGTDLPFGQQPPVNTASAINTGVVSTVAGQAGAPDKVVNLYALYASRTAAEIRWRWYAPQTGPSVTGYLSQVVDSTTGTVVQKTSNRPSHFVVGDHYEDSIDVGSIDRSHAQEVEVYSVSAAGMSLVASINIPVGPYTPATFDRYEGFGAGEHTFVVPSDMTSLSVTGLVGGVGEGAFQNSDTYPYYGGGRPASLLPFHLPVTPGETLTFKVGQDGGFDLSNRASPGLGGYPDGGEGGYSAVGGIRGGGGGGSTSIWRGSTLLAVAAGGGGQAGGNYPGASSYDPAWPYSGDASEHGNAGVRVETLSGYGPGSTRSGGASPTTAGAGGAHSATGTGGNNGAPGTGMIGGAGGNSPLNHGPGGGGGGGKFGGGGGGSINDSSDRLGGGGAGGSSWLHPSATFTGYPFRTYIDPWAGRIDSSTGNISFVSSPAHDASGSPITAGDTQERAFLLNPAPRQSSGTTEIVSTYGNTPNSFTGGNGVASSWFYFDVPTTSTVTLDTLGSTDSLSGDDYGDSYIYLLDSSQGIIDQQDDNAGDGDGTITQTLAPGRYYVVVSGYNSEMSDLRVNYSGLAAAAGPGTAGTFNAPHGVVFSGGFAYVAGADAVSKVNLSTEQVTVLAGSPGATGCTDSATGSSAQFSGARDMATDGYYGYVLDECGLRRVSLSTGAVSTMLSGTGYQGVTAGPDGMLYVTRTIACSGSTVGTLLRVNPVSDRTTQLAGGTCGSAMYGVAADATNVYFEADPTEIDKYNLSTGSITRLVQDSTLDYNSSLESAGSKLYTGTIASGGTERLTAYSKANGSRSIVAGGAPGIGTLDDQGAYARFGSINDIASDGSRLYVADGTGNQLRAVGQSTWTVANGQAIGSDPNADFQEDVNPGLESFTTSATDASISTLGPALSVNRSYNSADANDTGFGTGWTSSVGMGWQADGAGNLVVLYPDGRRETQTLNGDGTFTPPDGSASHLVADGSGGFTLTQPDGTVDALGSNHKLTSITDPTGSVQTYAYDDSGNLTTVTAANGRSLSFTWNGSHVASVSTNPVNGSPLTWTYSYTNGLLTKVCDPRGTGSDHCANYEYTAGLLTRIIKPLGTTPATVGYNPDGSVQFREDGLGHATLFTRTDAQHATVTDAAHHPLSQTFDPQLRLMAETDAGGGTQTFTYDARGFRNSTTDQNGNTTSSTFDTNGNPLTSTDASGHTAHSTYDASNNLLSQCDGRSASLTDTTYCTTYTYDSHHNKLSETQPDGATRRWTYSTGTEAPVGGGHMPAGLLLTESDFRGNATRYAYTAAGDLAETITPLGLRTDDTYDALGRKVSETVYSDTFPAGVTTTWTYDGLGAVLTQTGPAVTNVVTGVAHQLRATNSYDKNGNVLSVTQADLLGDDASRTTTYSYDSLDRQVTSTDAQTGQSMTQTYDERGNVVSVTDQLGRVTTTTYDALNRAIAVTQKDVVDDPIAGSAPHDVVLEQTSYDAAGQVHSETDALGHVKVNTYDASGHLTAVTLTNYVNPDGSTRSIVLQRQVYDAAGQLVDDYSGGDLRHVRNTYDTAGKLLSSTLDPGGLNRTTSYTYDVDGNVLTTTLSDGRRTETTTSAYDGNNDVVSTTISTGTTSLVTTATFDNRGVQTSSTDPRGNVTGADPAAYTTTTTTDELGRTVSVASPPVQVETNGGPPATTRPTSYSGYDSFGEVTQAKDANGNVTTTTYDRLGRKTSVTYPAYTTPAGATLTPSESWSYDAVGNQTGHVDRRGQSFSYVFDSRNRVVAAYDPLLAGQSSRGVTRTSYDDLGQRLSSVDQDGATSRWTYDALGRVATQTAVVRLADGGTENDTTSHTYDDQGDETQTQNPDGAVSAATFDPAGEMLTSTDPNSDATTYGYDLAGRQTSVTDPLGRKTTTSYDLAGRQTAQAHYDHTGALLTSTSTGYDAAGNQVSQTSARGFVTTMAYDAANRVTSVTTPGDHGEGITTTAGYDPVGNMTRFTDGRGNTTVRTYTSGSLLESTIEPATAAQPYAVDRTWTTTYDAGGLAVGEERPGGESISRSYDNLGRLLTEAGSGPGVTSATRSFGYDLAGQRTSLGTPGGQDTFSYDDRGLLTHAAGPSGTATFGHDTAGRLTQRQDTTGTSTFSYTARGQLATASDPLASTTRTYSYDSAGQPTSVAFTGPSGAGSHRDYAYDDLGQLVSDQLVNANGTVTAGYAYAHDADGNITSKTITLPGNPGGGTHTYSYDQQDRLTSWTTPGGVSKTYAWDAAGNRTQAGSASYTYDERNRQLTGPDGSTVWSPDGNLLSTTSAAGEASTYTYDALSRVTGSTSPLGQTSTSTYDSLDRLVTSNGTSLTYAGTSIKPVSDGTEKYARGIDDALLAVSDGSTASLASTDVHHDLTYLAAADGTISGSRVYDPFGTLQASAGTIASTLGYQSDITDPTTGNIWMGARWYGPQDDTFDSQDTVTGGIQDPGTLDRYTYALGDPLTRIDPDGHRPRDDEGDDPPTTLSRVLALQSPRMRGDDVSWVQKLLNQHPPVFVAVDGEYDPNTAAAVKSFQSVNGLRPDGKVGPQTWAKLRSASSSGTATSSKTDSNAQLAYQYLRDRKATATAAAAIVGNFMVEAPGVNPKCYQSRTGLCASSPQKGHPGRGIAQWSVNDRWKGVLRLADKRKVSPFTLRVQLDYMWNEFQSKTYDQVYARIQSTRDLDAATDDVCRYYEIAGKDNLPKRHAAARKMFNANSH